MFNSVILIYCRMNFRVPPSSNYVQMAAAGRATGVWTDENTPLVSRCHQVLQEHQWSSQVYQDIINLILIQHSAQVVLLAGVNMTMTTKVKGPDEREFSRCHRAQPHITNHPFR